MKTRRSDEDDDQTGFSWSVASLFFLLIITLAVYQWWY